LSRSFIALKILADLTETLEARFIPCLKAKLHFITRVDMRKESDGKYRISRSVCHSLHLSRTYIFIKKVTREQIVTILLFCLSIRVKSNDIERHIDGEQHSQEDNYPNDLKRSGIPLFGIPTLTATYKIVAGTIISCVGRFLLEKGLLGP
jgi:hypothetical protein